VQATTPAFAAACACEMYARRTSRHRPNVPRRPSDASTGNARIPEELCAITNPLRHPSVIELSEFRMTERNAETGPVSSRDVISGNQITFKSSFRRIKGNQERRSSRGSDPAVVVLLFSPRLRSLSTRAGRMSSRRNFGGFRNFAPRKSLRGISRVPCRAVRPAGRR